MTTMAGGVFASHLDSEASKKAHPHWYRFGDGVLWFTFPNAEDVPEKCPDCGEKFFLGPVVRPGEKQEVPPGQAGAGATVGPTCRLKGGGGKP